MPAASEPRAPSKRVAFVTIGQSPRVDVMGELLPRLGPGIEAVEYGALDDLERDQIAGLAPEGCEERLCTRLRDGTEVVITKDWTLRRLQALMHRLDGAGFDLIVLLCTGTFEGLSAKTPMVEAQEVLDGAVRDLARDGSRVGVMVPLEAQIAEFEGHEVGYRPARVTHASPYSDARLAAAGSELAEMDLIAMHCMGYTEAMRDEVARVSGRPTLLARSLLAEAIAERVRQPDALQSIS
ncbi:MAG: AroM family protein [Alphaproteobacteria bacterium]|jgi:protein AroM|nr:AroM family protein [Alphaproteobacteria bacterium]